MMEQVAPTRERRARPSEGRDEFNLAEFPLTLLTDRPPRGIKTLQWEDQIVDRATGLPVNRQVVVTGSDAFGLPTASDSDVLFALVQLTKLKNNFGSKDVLFSRYELIRILGWRDEGKCYKRLEDSLDRWHGTSIYFSAWRDKETETWRSEKFHIIDNVSLLGRSSRRQLLAQGQEELAFSSFSWNKVVFRNLQAGYVCPLDLDLYFSLRSSISKRMLRYLTKHFRLRQQNALTFDLKTFAFEKVGLSRTYRDSGQIKKELQAGIEELESIGFLSPLSREQRYTKLHRGVWTITLQKHDNGDALMEGEDESQPGLPEDPDELVQALVNRGVTLDTSRLIRQEAGEEEIRRRIAVLDWMIGRNDERASRNPPGYLIQSIRQSWPLPKDFLIWEEREAKRLAREKLQRERDAAARHAKAEDDTRMQAEEARIQAFWKRLSPEQRAATEAAAMSQADLFLVQRYEQASREESKVAELYRRMIRNSYVLQILDKEPSVAVG